jgi:NAD+ kinase
MVNRKAAIGPIRTVGLVARENLHAAADVLAEAFDWLEHRGINVLADEVTATLAHRPDTPTATKDALPARVDLVVVLGGDGTLLGMADRIAKADADVPIMGVNFGSLGFLTEITLEDFFPALDGVLKGCAQVDLRLMLRSRVLRNDTIRADHRVLNDVVVSRGAASPIVDLSVSVDGAFVTHVRADGLIVASPTGSTAYNLACGGPILHPAADAVVLAPIAPHTLTNRPVVIPASAETRIRPTVGQAGNEVVVSFDGQESVQLTHGDEVSVRSARKRLRLVCSARHTYFEVLRQKLKWGER